MVPAGGPLSGYYGASPVGRAVDLNRPISMVRTIMTDHKFKVGQVVRVADIFEKGGPQAYSVTRLLPAEKEGPQYRLKAANALRNASFWRRSYAAETRPKPSNEARIRGLRRFGPART